MIDGLKAMLASGDAVAFSRYAHSIKGMVGLFKAEEASHLAQELEIKGKTCNLKELSQYVENLSGSLDRLKDTLLKIAGDQGFKVGK